MAQTSDDPKGSERPNLRAFSASADRNGQDLGQDEARDLARPAELQRERDSDLGWQAETVRTASGHARLDSVSGGRTASVEATEAETPPENLRRLGDASTTPKAS
ncbi:hypothetical protein MMSR116_05800 [Methylobacterium mesophilicum SR1.6/6]|uniref:Uncharacterized protein n=1 Tax=Methylobacterium mesophilicum SR1.6/6 TaxID=908290 RepID=A0A6B9FFT6_9HYPH|nr:hypothetical protein [Methylobacterium mesophilicum]QGY01467.1 hypothetical protein MMSR116_05800 [Methylobacterium mesophilicum SR1.6/6]